MISFRIIKPEEHLSVCGPKLYCTKSVWIIH